MKTDFYLDLRIFKVLLDLFKGFRKTRDDFLIKGIDLQDFRGHSPESIGLYIHYPFCKTICIYCPFNKTLYQKDLEEKYIENLLYEIELMSPVLSDIPINRVYVGGGTPSLMSEESLEKIITTVKSRYRLKENVRMGIEVRAVSLSPEKIKLLKQLGFDRISFGIQTFNMEVLRKVARPEDLEEAKRKIGMSMGHFRTVNIDLMFGLPLQSLDIWEDDLRKAVSLGVNHITTYPLLLMSNTPLYRLVKMGRMKLPKEKDKYFGSALEYLTQQGFSHRIVWTFTRGLPKEATYSTTEQSDEYVGFGAGAYTYFKNFLKINTYSPVEYIETFKSEKPKAFYKEIGEQAKITKAFIFELLWMELNIPEFEKRFNINLNKKFGKIIFLLKCLGVLKEENSVLKVTKKGRYFLSMMSEYSLVGGSQSRNFYLGRT